ncbi:MAG: hypothetical protein GF333_03705 [Candidatus Omnitrophica bacterium]|nr:hypothetical protein [Candidatus Omnitrophota bacterium]
MRENMNNQFDREKRRFVRACFPCKIVIYPPREHTISTHTENIGAGGVRVILGERLHSADIVGLKIYLGEGEITCKGRVVWVVTRSRQDETHFDTGIEFYQISDRDRQVIDSFVLQRNEQNDTEKD